jgi:thiol-disulfide isomerase/thioredoxin
LIANPRRAREHFAPEFSFVSSAGERFTLESLRGKVVLLDFWGTSCALCVRAIPSLRKLQKDHAQDAFVILSISSDKDPAVWRTFIGKNGMVWPQYFDGDHEMSSTFDVSVFPTYVLLDGEGIERLRVKAAGFHEAKALSAAIDQQLKR